MQPNWLVFILVCLLGFVVISNVIETRLYKQVLRRIRKIEERIGIDGHE